jgi:hypothetical protein
MAMESACKLEVGREHYEGRVRMSGDHIDFAGSTKFRFRISEMRDPDRSEQSIVFNFHGNPVNIELSSLRAAENWIAYILHPQTLADKLGVKEGQTIRVMNLEDEDLLTSLQSKNTKMASRATSRCDLVMLGVERSAELRQLEDISESLRPKGAIWVVLPKTGRLVTKANVSAAAREAGLNQVDVVDYSETMSAFKIVRPSAPKKRSGGNGNGHDAATRQAAAS